jgi:tetratricopeptide (TPR) repeat protein
VVDIDSAFHRAAADGVPGHDLFFEHVHPLPRGTALIADAFFDALAADRFEAHSVSAGNATARDTMAMQLTGLDRRIASLITEALTQRWPFVARDSGTRFLETYRPVTTTDSLALAVVTGRMTWVEAKLGAAQRFESAQAFSAAVAEYRGLMRDQPWNESPFRFAARALIAAGKPAEARPLLERAYATGPTAYTCYALATLVRADSGGLPRAAALLRQSLQLGGFNPAVLYQLSLVLGQQGDLQGARASAVQLYRAAPTYPGLREWMKLLGM